MNAAAAARALGVTLPDLVQPLVGEAVAFLLSEAARGISGARLPVAGRG